MVMHDGRTWCLFALSESVKVVIERARVHFSEQSRTGLAHGFREVNESWLLEEALSACV